jgi:chromosome segregation ATPase
MKTLIHLTLCGLLLWCVSCAPKAIPLPPGYQPQAPVPQAEDAMPYVDGLRDAHALADAASAINQARSDNVANQTATLRAGINKVTAEADRLRKQKAATEEELDSLWQLLTHENERAIALFAEAEKARDGLIEERRLRAEANAKLAPLQKAVVDISNEAKALRLQLADAEAGSLKAHQSAENFAQLAAADKARADKAEGKISVWKNIAFGAVFIALVLLLWTIFKPRIL